MSLNWESKFSSIVRETEANLAKVRQRLGNTRSSSYDNGATYTPKVNFSGSYMTSYVSPTSFNSPLSQTKSESQIVSSNEPTPGLVVLLNEKIDQQTNLIENLTKQILSLEKDQDQLRNRMQNYEVHIRTLEKRLNEKGVDLETERKIDIWKKEVKTELRDLQTQLRFNKSGDNRYSEQVEFLSREMRDSKRVMQDENDSLRRDVESLKTKLLSHDEDLSSQLMETKDLGRRIERLDRNVGNVNDSQRRHNREMSDTLQSNQSTQLQITQIRAEMAKLLDTVTKIENKETMVSAQGNGNKLSLDKLHHNDFEMKKPSEVDMSELSLSDFDISSVSLADYHISGPSFRLKNKVADFEVSPISDLDMTIDINDLDLSATASLSSVELQSDLL
ncbi:myosin heavy chain, clone 203-like [Ptychodera flava]|uniref:myosin heavy chain, clone 203-like n=1 Tax=Ptychodera flava TaxID=63121 RepID=UPI003969E455